MVKWCIYLSDYLTSSDIIPYNQQLRLHFPDQWKMCVGLFHTEVSSENVSFSK